MIEIVARLCKNTIYLIESIENIIKKLPHFFCKYKQYSSFTKLVDNNFEEN
jgi:hypothetical protein